MEQLTPTAKDLAALVYGEEHSLNADAIDYRHTTQRLFEKLDRHLSVRLGAGGYYTLMKRAIALAAKDNPALFPIQVSQEGTITGFQDMTGPEGARDACVATLTCLIELLDTFIGRSLTARILRNSWPNAVRIEEVSQSGESNG